VNDFKSGFNDAMDKCDQQIEKLFFELKEMKEGLRDADWSQNELAGGMLALSILKRTLIELYLMEDVTSGEGEKWK
jgi:hypothetical protein